MFIVRRCAVAALLLCASATAFAAEPYTPPSDATVLAKVAGKTAAGPSALRELRRTLAANPNDVATAAAYAEKAIALGRAEADPRYFGMAEAAITTWWKADAPPPSIRFVRATLLQQRHQFDAALQDLDALLRADPGNTRARLTRAVVRQVQGHPQLAQHDCAELVGQASLLTATTCLASAGGLSGRAANFYAVMDRLLATPTIADAPPEERRWAITVAAELAARLGRGDDAARWFQQGLQLAASEAVDDVYLKCAWADFQLARGHATEVEVALRDARADAVLLRLTLAERQLADAGQAKFAPRWQAHRDELASRFATARARGEGTHGREEALFELHLRNNPGAALKLARDNWSVQHEPTDARALLEAAAAANDHAAADPVRAWLLETHLEDAALLKLAGPLPAAVPMRKEG